MGDEMAVMASGKPPVLVVIQLTGGNDFMNTIVPYSNGVYHDARPTVGIKVEDVLPIDDTLGFYAKAATLKELYDRGKVAIVQGVGYPNSNRSHFRGMDIVHTCEAESVGTEGWVARAVRELDPRNDNVLTCVNIGRGLPRAMAAPGVTVTSVGNLDNYGLMTGMTAQAQREQALDLFKKIYTPTSGTGAVMDYLAQTGRNVLEGADRLKAAPAGYSSEVKYAGDPIATNLRDIARIHLAGLGTRIFYTAHGGYDYHANEVPTHARLISELSTAIKDFYQDLEDHGAQENVAILVFTEFGRRIRDNGSGTDHGSGGGSFIIGDRVNGGLYADYPSLDPNQWLDGEDLTHTIDFRGVYATLLEQWMGLDAVPIVGGSYEQIQPFH
jgi:uncharacterized protein (DUF1501 family)